MNTPKSHVSGNIFLSPIKKKHTLFFIHSVFVVVRVLEERRGNFSFLPLMDFPVHDFVPLPLQAQAVWSELLRPPDSQRCSNKFMVKGLRRKTSEIEPILFHSSRKTTQRRLNPSDPPAKRTTQALTVEPTQTLVEYPTSVDDAQQKIVNALSGILPLDAKMNIFGFWHSVVLVGVFYRHDSLCWILLNRLNHRLYITAHFLADSLHLFQEIRGNMRLDAAHRDKKWTRQGVKDRKSVV